MHRSLFDIAFIDLNHPAAIECPNESAIAVMDQILAPMRRSIKPELVTLPAIAKPSVVDRVYRSERGCFIFHNEIPISFNWSTVTSPFETISLAKSALMLLTGTKRFLLIASAQKAKRSLRLDFCVVADGT